MSKKKQIILLFFLFSFSTYCAISIGQSWDEGFHLYQGKITLDYLFSLGQIKTPLFKYMCYTASSSYNLKYSIIDFKYYYYDSNLTYFKENLVYGFTVIPPLKSDKYKMYGKISSHIFMIFLHCSSINFL